MLDNKKTGELIASIRKQKNMTQQEIADQLHVTSKAVSKWERGQSFPSVDILQPLAAILEISVVDILTGEVVDSGALPVAADKISVQALKSQQKSRRNLYVVLFVSVILLVGMVLASWGPVIFQRGNPLPYLISAMQISEERPFVEVATHSGVYLSKRGECPELFQMIEESRGVELVEQVGSGFVFTNGADQLTVSSEIFWSKYTVWQVPQHTLQAK